MKVAQFKAQPSKLRHTAYSTSLFATTAPEYATGEVLLGSVYRRLILGVHDNEVDLSEIALLPGRISSEFGGAQVWTDLLRAHNGLASPLRGGQQSGGGGGQLMPLVPEVARFACVLGAKGKRRWRPANLALESIGAGAGSEAGQALIGALGHALSVGVDDDLLARFVSRALQNMQGGGAPTPPYSTLQLDPSQLSAYRGKEAAVRRTPAERFCKDLSAVLHLKHRLSRRQWTVLVEATLRVGLGCHVLWVCQLNDLIWQQVVQVADGAAVPTADDLERQVWEAHHGVAPLLELGSHADPMLRRTIERYVHARFGLNYLLYHWDDVAVPWPAGMAIGYASGPPPRTAVQGLVAFLEHVATHRNKLAASMAGGWLVGEIAELIDADPGLRTLCRGTSGFGKNLFEFFRHTLGQIKAANADDKAYDQSYLIANPGDRKPMPVQPGPAMLIMLVHACSDARGTIPASLEDLRVHLSEYGIRVPAGELLRGKVGEDLAMLGLVVDSPDAAGGRVLIRPFGAP